MDDDLKDPLHEKSEPVTRRQFLDKAGKFVLATAAYEIVSLTPFLAGCDDATVAKTKKSGKLRTKTSNLSGPASLSPADNGGATGCGSCVSCTPACTTCTSCLTCVQACTQACVSCTEACTSLCTSCITCVGGCTKGCVACTQACTSGYISCPTCVDCTGCITCTQACVSQYIS